MNKSISHDNFLFLFIILIFSPTIIFGSRVHFCIKVSKCPSLPKTTVLGNRQNRRWYFIKLTKATKDPAQTLPPTCRLPFPILRMNLFHPLKERKGKDEIFYASKADLTKPIPQRGYACFIPSKSRQDTVSKQVEFAGKRMKQLEIENKALKLDYSKLKKDVKRHEMVQQNLADS